MGPFFYFTAYVSLLFAFTQALPTINGATAGLFSIEQKQYRSNRVNWPPYELWRTLRKHHRPPPRGMTAVSRIKAYGEHTINGTVEVTPSEYDTEFVNEITVGNDTLYVDIDTGSSDFWVFSSQLPEQSQRNHRIYHPEETGTKLPKHTWESKYGDGTGAAGNVFLDKVNLAGLKVSSQAVEAATWVSYEFVDQQTTDGVMGFGFDNFNLTCLKHQAPGFYDFGFIDGTKHVGKPTYLPIDSLRGWWETTFNGFSAGDIDNSTYRFKAVIGINFELPDTGTTFMLLPKQITEQYYSTVPASMYDRNNGGWAFPCNTTLPNFTIHINDHKAIVPGEHIRWAQLPGTNTCFGGLQPVNNPPAILGGTFLKSQFVIFDYDGPKIGFAAQRN
ncbi:hypothetical protein McanMca71_002685 [Microsporum canis]